MKSGDHRRREPERTCIGCRTTSPKAGLVRIVRQPDGIVRVDRSGKAAGRGAYVHPIDGCMARTIRTGALARALRAPLDKAEAARLMKELLQQGEAG